MIFFFSIGDRKHNDHGPLDEELCPFCNERHFRVLSLVRYWVTVFFIPILPYRTIWVSRCTYCSGESEIDEGELPILKSRSDILQKAVDEDWSEEQLEDALNQSHHL